MANIFYGQPYEDHNNNSDEDGEVKIEEHCENCDFPSSIYKDGSLKRAPTISCEENNEKPTESLPEDLQTPNNEVENNLPIYNRRALSRFADTYELETFERKVLVIFNQKNVEGYEPRLGTEKDVEALTRTFENVGFKVTEHTDFTKKQLLNELRIFFDQDFTDVGCIAIAVLTHGNENGMLRAKDRAYNEVEITEYLQSTANPTLLTKPKFLIVQACRGTKTNIAVPVHAAIRTTFKDVIDYVEPYTMPSEADQLILHSTYTGNPSFRNTVEGSWLIQSLCKHIDVLADTTDLEAIIVAVKKEVAIESWIESVNMNLRNEADVNIRDRVNCIHLGSLFTNEYESHEEYSRRTNDMIINKQIPVMTSTLIRKLYLRKFENFTETNETTLNFTLNSMMLFSNTDVEDTMSAPETPSVISSEPLPDSSTSKKMNLSSKQYFIYLVNCLEYYLDDNPEDTVAHSFLQVSRTFGKGKKFDAAKEEMINIICKYLLSKEDKIHFYKYLFLKKR